MADDLFVAAPHHVVFNQLPTALHIPPLHLLDDCVCGNIVGEIDTQREQTALAGPKILLLVLADTLDFDPQSECIGVLLNSCWVDRYRAVLPLFNAGEVLQRFVFLHHLIIDLDNGMVRPG